ncbi:MAG TPA: hypothetical protein VFA59_17955, partial [Vicinamibacterales bacterium]|nr:hypothetical protein [Vicinamibacterales bacterium]
MAKTSTTKTKMKPARKVDAYGRVEIRTQAQLTRELAQGTREFAIVGDADLSVQIPDDVLFTVRGTAQPRVVAYGSSQPRVEAYDSSQPRVVASGSSQPRVVAYGSSQPRVEASDSSQPRVVAYGSSQPRVEAYDSSQPRVV